MGLRRIFDLQQSNREYRDHTEFPPVRQLQAEDHGDWQNQDVGINDRVGGSRDDCDNPSIGADRIILRVAALSQVASAVM